MVTLITSIHYFQPRLQAREANNDRATAPLQGTGGEENIYDEVYELPESNVRTAARAARSDRKSEIPSYYVMGHH